MKKKPMMSTVAIRDWMVEHVAEHLYDNASSEVDTTALFDAFIVGAGDHHRPLHDEDHPAWWIAVEVAVAYEDGELDSRAPRCGYIQQKGRTADGT
jgi:hypothetical protein